MNFTTEDLHRSINTCIEDEVPECAYNKRRIFKTVPFFCGQDEFCLEPGPRALEQAKMNVIKYFAVVGILEEYQTFLKVLTCVFPQYFQGSVNLYVNQQTKAYKVTKHTEEITEQNRRMLEKTLSLEYDFYHFIKNRFSYLSHELDHLCQ